MNAKMKYSYILHKTNGENYEKIRLETLDAYALVPFMKKQSSMRKQPL